MQKDPQLRADLFAARGIPLYYLDSEQKTTSALYELTDYENKKENCYFDPRNQEAYLLVVEALRQLCCRKSSKVLRRRVSQQEVVSQVNRCADFDGEGYTLEELINCAMAAYRNALAQRLADGESPLKKPLNYAHYVVWTVLCEYQPDDEYFPV